MATRKPSDTTETTVETSKLLTAARLCASVADAKSPILPYQSTLVRMSVDGCELIATNGSVSIRSVVSLEPKGAVVAFCVNAKRLVGVVAHMPDGWLQIKSGETRVVISSGPGRATAEIATTPASDFPVTEATEVPGLVGRESTLTLLRQVAFASPPNDVAADKNSIRLDVSDGRLTAWAMNGHMLAVATADSDKAPMQSSLHAAAAQVFMAVLDAGNDPFARLMTGDVMAVSSAGTTAWAKTTGARHQPWRTLIPEGAQTLTCSRHDVLDAIGRAGLFATKDRPNVDLSVTEADSRFIQLSSAGFAADGTASTHIELSEERKPTKVSVSWRYLRDALAAIDADRVDIAIVGPLNPIVIRPAGVTDGQMYLIAPMDRS